MKLQADVLFGIVIVLALAISMTIIYYVYTQINSNLSPLLSTNQSAATINSISTNTSTGLSVFLVAVVIVYFAINIAAIISAFFVDAYPVFFVISMFMVAIEVLLAAIGHNVFFYIEQQLPTFATLVTTVPYLFYLFAYLPVITLILAFTLVIVLYSKR